MQTDEKHAGFALAALLADDRALEHVERAIAPELAGAVRAELAQLGAHKAAGVAQLLDRVRPPLRAAPPLPPRAITLLAPQLPRPNATVIAPARPGYVAPRDLLPLLLRIARAERAAYSEQP